MFFLRGGGLDLFFSGDYSARTWFCKLLVILYVLERIVLRSLVVLLVVFHWFSRFFFDWFCELLVILMVLVFYWGFKGFRGFRVLFNAILNFEPYSKIQKAIGIICFLGDGEDIQLWQVLILIDVVWTPFRSHRRR